MIESLANPKVRFVSIVNLFERLVMASGVVTTVLAYALERRDSFSFRAVRKRSCTICFGSAGTNSDDSMDLVMPRCLASRAYFLPMNRWPRLMNIGG